MSSAPARTPTADAAPVPVPVPAPAVGRRRALGRLAARIGAAARAAHAARVPF
jgi:hypothetical protein